MLLKALMKLGVLANATQSLDADTAELVVAELGHKGIRVNDDDILKEIEDFVDNDSDLKKGHQWLLLWVMLIMERLVF